MLVCVTQHPSDPDERYAVRLRALRHPLLYGDYLRTKTELEQRVRAVGGKLPGSASTPG